MTWLHTFFGTHKEPVVKGDATTLDVITYLASLVSTPREIDPTLDTVREISARIKPGEALSTTDEAALAKVYGAIEHYLTERDPIRRFTHEEVQRRVHGRFPRFSIKL